MRIPSGVTDQVIYFVAVDSADLKTRETGLSSFTVYRDRNGGGATAMTTPTVTEVDASNMPGVYKLLLDEDMTIGAGNDSEEMCFHITQAGMAPVTRTIELYRPKITAGDTLATSSGKFDEVSTLTGHSVQTGDNFARLGAPAGATVSADVAAVKADTAATLVDTAVIGAAGAGLTDLGGMSTGMKAEVNAECDTALADINLDHFIPVASTVNDGSPSASNFDTDLTEATSGHYNDMVIVFTSGALSGQSRRINLYLSGTNNIAVSPALTEAPANGDAFVIVSGVYLRVLTEGLSANANVAIESDCNKALVAVNLHSLIRIAGSVNDGTPAAGTFDGDSGLSTTDDFYNGMVLAFNVGPLNGLARRVSDYVGSTRTFTLENAFPFAPPNGDEFVIMALEVMPGGTVAQVAAAVWNEDLAAHQTAASAGEELHVAKAVVANKRTHDTATQVDSILDNDGSTLLRTMTPVSDAGTGIITVTPT